LKEAIRNRQTGFQRVTASVTPYDVWATTEQSRDYFRQFQGIAVAKVGEAPPPSGWPDAVVRFQFWRDRNYQKDGLGAITGLSQLEFEYNGEAFVPSGNVPSSDVVWYATNQTQSSEHRNPNNEPKFSLVNYKGKLIQVKALQEIYDPQTRNILLLRSWYKGYPWGGPDEIDIKRLMAGRN